MATKETLDHAGEEVRSSFAKYALKKAFNILITTRTTMKETSDSPDQKFDKALENAQAAIMEAIATL